MESEMAKRTLGYDHEGALEFSIDSPNSPASGHIPPHVLNCVVFHLGEIDQRLQLAALLGIETAFRLGDLLRVKVKMAQRVSAERRKGIILKLTDSKSFRLAIAQGRQPKPRSVELTPEMKLAFANALRYARENSYRTWLFERQAWGKKGEQLSRQYAARQLRRAVNRAAAEEPEVAGYNIGWHSFRKIAALNHLAANGGDWDKTRRFLGHTNLQVTRRYLIDRHED